MAVLADRLLRGLKRRAIVPASQPLLTNSDIFEMADDTIKGDLVPLIKSVNQDFFVYIETEDLVPYQDEYPIPYRAIGRTLRDLKLQDNTTPVPNRSSMALIALEDSQYYRTGSIPLGFYFKGDRIVVIPMPLNNTVIYKLEKWYELQPNKLITLTDAAVVQSVGATTVTVVSAPATISEATPVDFIQGTSGCGTLGMDATITNISGNTYTFAADVIPETLTAGDYISVAQTSPVIQLPDEAYTYLETCLAIEILKTLGDFEGAGRLVEDAKNEKENLLKILQPRIEGEPTKCINRRGLLRAYRGRFLSSRYFY